MLNPRDCFAGLLGAAFIVAYSLFAFLAMAGITSIALVTWLFFLPARVVRAAFGAREKPAERTRT